MRSWPSYALFPIAAELAYTIRCWPLVSGVAVSGSVARRDLHLDAHDLDLVVFTHGVADGWWRDTPDQPSREVDGLLPPDGSSRLRSIAKDVPISLCFVREHILWDCAYLQGLAEGEKYPGIYLAIFRQTPLVLLHPERCKNGIKRFAQGLKPMMYFGHPDCIGVQIEHRCGSPGCEPERPWNEIYADIVARKTRRSAAVVPEWVDQAWRPPDAYLDDDS